MLEEIITLVKTFPQVMEYYKAQLSPVESYDILDKYKKLIQNEIYPSRGYGKLRLTNIRKAIGDYKKISSSIEGRVELLLFFVEQGADFINEFGDIKENFYGSMESAYEEACELIVSKGLEKEWKDQFEELVEATSHTGYDFGDNIRYMFNEKFCKTIS